MRAKKELLQYGCGNRLMGEGAGRWAERFIIMNGCGKNKLMGEGAGRWAERFIKVKMQQNKKNMNSGIKSAPDRSGLGSRFKSGCEERISRNTNISRKNIIKHMLTFTSITDTL